MTIDDLPFVPGYADLEVGVAPIDPVSNHSARREARLDGHGFSQALVLLLESPDYLEEVCLAPVPAARFLVGCREQSTPVLNSPEFAFFAAVP